MSAHTARYVAAISGTLPFIAALAFVAYGLVFLQKASLFSSHHTAASFFGYFRL